MILPLPNTVRTPQSSRRRLLRAIFATIAVAACAGTDSTPHATQLIAAVRALAQSAHATVEGVATVGAGTYDDGFAVQDATGGIYVTSALGATIEIGDRVRVTGHLVAPNNQLGIDPAAVIKLDAGSTPVPAELKTGAAGPASEGRLIAVNGKVAGKVVDDQPWGWKLYVDDGSGPLLIFIATSTNIDVRALRAGQRLRVTGFNGRYEQHTELLPRGPRDVIAAAE